jgi:hypothetical protein
VNPLRPRNTSRDRVRIRGWDGGFFLGKYSFLTADRIDFRWHLPVRFGANRQALDSPANRRAIPGPARDYGSAFPSDIAAGRVAAARDRPTKSGFFGFQAGRIDAAFV